MATSENVRSNEISKSESFDPGRNAATKRLQKELMELMMFTDKSISAFPESDNLFKWIATINGPNDTVYDGLKFKLTLNFSAKYPYVAPKVKFITHCFHPNINSDGEICLDILKDKWTALYDVRTVLLSIQSLLGEPNLDSPLDTHAAAIWGQAEFKQFVLCQYNGQSNAASKK